MTGIISQIIEGPVSSEIDVAVNGGNVISATITHGSSEKLHLKKGEQVSAIFKASSVIIGIS
ncbi:MAG: TOBE domain-containing protein [Chlorobiaceae bacterium]|nr:TOBE domain-containing protein [Chlorobiaceae bacterium]